MLILVDKEHNQEDPSYFVGWLKTTTALLITSNGIKTVDGNDIFSLLIFKGTTRTDCPNTTDNEQGLSDMKKI